MLTPTSPLPFLGFTLTLPDNVTVVEADPAPYSNTKEILVQNFSEDHRVFMQIAQVDGALPAAGTITALNSHVIGTSGKISICLGMEGDRMPIGTVAFWIANPGARYVLVFLAEDGTNLEINVTYVQGIGGSTGTHGGC